MTYVGIDENGLGPLLGPFVATGVSVVAGRAPGFHPVIADSKRVFQSGRQESFRRIEATALAAARLAYGGRAEHPRAFLTRVTGVSGCDAADPFCWNHLPDAALWADSADVERMVQALGRWLGEAGCRRLNISCGVVCPAELNRQFAAGISKSAVNLQSFISLIWQMAGAGGEVESGKVGGTRRYREALEAAFPAARVSVLCEEPDLSRYSIAGQAHITVSFRQDVEEVSSLACLASIVGKYVREMFMEAINRALGTGERISGYRDPRTRAAVASAPAWLPARCLIRNR